MRSGLFLVTLLLLGQTVTAQISNHGAEIVIQSGTQVYSPGLYNEGIIVNDGSLNISGDIRQYTGKYSGTGKVELAGTSPQLVELNPTVMAEVILDNPEGITLRGSLEISGVLSLVSGRLHTSDQDTLLLADKATISGGSPASFISGPLHHSGTGNKFYPIGYNDTYLPVTLDELRGGNSLVTAVVTNTNVPVSGAMPATYELLDPYYWQRESYGDVFSGTKVILPLFDEFADRNRLMIASATKDLTAYDIPSEVSFVAGDYYTGVMSVSEIYGEVIALAMADPALADAAPFYIPNAINASAAEDDNRVIKVYGDIRTENFIYVVFDRRGSEIFKSHDLEFMRSTGWDGRMGQTGKMAPAGSYIYAVKGETSDGQTINQTGQVVIVR